MAKSAKKQARNAGKSEVAVICGGKFIRCANGVELPSMPEGVTRRSRYSVLHRDGKVFLARRGSLIRPPA